METLLFPLVLVTTDGKNRISVSGKVNMITVAEEPPGSVGKAQMNVYKNAAETICVWSKKVSP